MKCKPHLAFYTYTYEPFLLKFWIRRQEAVFDGLQYNTIGVAFWNYILMFVWFSKKGVLKGFLYEKGKKELAL